MKSLLKIVEQLDIKSYYSNRRVIIFIVWIFASFFIIGFVLGNSNSRKYNEINNSVLQHAETVPQHTDKPNESLTPIISAVIGGVMAAAAALVGVYLQNINTRKRDKSQILCEKIEELCLTVNEYLALTTSSYYALIRNLRNDDNYNYFDMHYLESKTEALTDEEQNQLDIYKDAIKTHLSKIVDFLQENQIAFKASHILTYLKLYANSDEATIYAHNLFDCQELFHRSYEENSRLKLFNPEYLETNVKIFESNTAKLNVKLHKIVEKSL